MKLTAMGWTGATNEAPKRMDWGLLPPDVATLGHRVGGDITGGAGQGRGIDDGSIVVDGGAASFRSPTGEWEEVAPSAGVKALQASNRLTPRRVPIKQARPVGEGLDKEMRGAIAQAEQEERWPWIAEEIRKEQEVGLRLMKLAGGEGFSKAQSATWGGGGCAARAARSLTRKYGKSPSSTSIQDAASDAVSAMWAKVSSKRGVRPEHWERSRFLKLLWRIGWRAAHKSLVEFASPVSGRSSEVDKLQFVPLSDVQLEVEQAGLQTWANQAAVRPPSAKDNARETACRWVWAVLVGSIKGKGAGPSQARRTAAQRARVLVRLLHGQSLSDAARLSGFASGRAAVESFRSGQVWAKLGDACTDHWERMPELKHLRARARVTALRAGKLIKAQRALASGMLAKGVAGTAKAVRRESGGVVLAVTGEGGTVRDYTCTRRATERAEVRPCWVQSPLAGQWARVTDERGRAFASAMQARRLLLQHRGGLEDSWRKASQGWRAGWLR
ncbi:MAG TPA: hypothetical protein VGH19_06920 [Verrucomicrobiae bacterium]